MKTKTCTLCKQEFPLSAFGKHSITKDGLSYWCKQCNRERSKKYSYTAPGVYSSIKGRQKFYETHGSPQTKPFKISKIDFVEWYNKQEKTCIYCGIREEEIGTLIDFFNDKTRRLTVDCKDNDLGYINGNLILACHKCNFIKSNIFTHEEMLEIGERYLKPKLEQFRITKGEADAE